MHRLLIVFAICLLVGCGAPGQEAPAAVAPAPTASPACSEEAGAFIAQIDPIAREWDDAVTLASNTPRASLSSQIETLQSLRRKAQDLEAPACAITIKDALVNTMELKVRGFIAFLGQKPDADVDRLFALADRYQRHYGNIFQLLRSGAPLPAADETLIEGLGISGETIQRANSDFRFKEDTTSDGAPLLKGAWRNESIELIGPFENIQSAQRTIAVRKVDKAELPAIEQKLSAFLKQAAGDWAEGELWLHGVVVLDIGKEDSAITRGRVVTFQHLDTGWSTSFILSVELP
jgi:hypothetical protein